MPGQRVAATLRVERFSSARKMFRRLGGRLLVATLALGAVFPLAAHDLWIEPTTFTPEPGQLVGVKLRVGVDLVGDPLPWSSTLIDQFVFVDAAGRQPLIGRERADPAAVLRARLPGLGVIGYHSRPSRIELPADKFEAYLQEEGLDDILALRKSGAAGHTGTRERFFRCAKSLLRVGPPNETQSDQVLGFPLELVAERNPYTQGAGEDLPVRLTYEGRPLANALVVAIRRTDPIEKLAVRSDSDGRVRLRLQGGGMWLIKAVHMVPVPAGADSGADWSSYWASLTFQPSGSGTELGR